MASPVTLLFTDIQGSTLMLDRLGDGYAELLAEHHRVMRAAIGDAGGREVSTAGDSFFAVFPTSGAAVDCACRAQLGLRGGRWPDGAAPRVRMGIHTGAPTARDGDFFGMDVHRAARVMAVAHGGQVLLTESACDALGISAPTRDLGYHRLKDLPAPEHLFQLLAPGLEVDFPPLRSLNRSNLPTPPNPLVGRAAEVSAALCCLRRPEVRLLTLLGPGGSGKSRLAMEVAAEARSRYRDGAWLVLLAPMQDPRLMAAEIARVLEVDAVPGKSIENALATSLAQRELLLVLDNFEHLLEAADTIAQVLSAAPNVDVLATSREPLRLLGEHRLDVAPLPLEEAGELFMQRARAVRHDLVTGEEDMRAVERICARLDGLPLAVELAAAHIAAFSPRTLEARLAEGLPLSPGPRDLPERHRTVRSTIDWSYHLLDRQEQALLASLSPFVGGVRPDTAAEGWGVEAVDRLISLAEKSFLRPRDDPDGEPRFRMLELIRQYATEVAESDDLAGDAAERHARCCLALTERARPYLIGPVQLRWLDRLESEHANLRAALDYYTEHAPEKALRMASTLTWFWDMRGYHIEARRRLDEALARAPAKSPSRGDALHCAAWMAWNQGDAEAAQPLLREALPLLTQQGDQRLLTEVYTHSAIVAEMLGEHDSVMALHRKAIATARDAGDDWALGVALNNCAIVRTLRTDLSLATSLLEKALTALRPTGDAYMISIVLANRAEFKLYGDDLDSAQALTEEALALARQIEFRPLIAGMLEFEALIALERGDVQAADSRVREALDIGLPFQSEAFALRLTLSASLASARGQSHRAATLWGAAASAYAHVGFEDPPILNRLRDRWLPQAQAAAPDPETWDAAYAAGADLGMEDALALVATGHKQPRPADRSHHAVPGSSPAQDITAG